MKRWFHDALFVIVARPMSLSASRKVTSLALVATLLAWGSAGCDEVSARRTIQKGDKLYTQAKYTDAIKQYEEALAKSPDLAIGHHNAALAHYRLFTPGDPSAENKVHAEKAADHFLAYLEHSPNDSKVIQLVTQIWLDSDQFEKALSYWERIRAEDPKNPLVLARLADINRMAGRFDKALELLAERVEVEPDEAGKVRGYLDIAQLQWSRLTKPELVDAERIEVADVGIAALQKAAEINKENAQLQSLMGSLYQFRALAHGASWARTVEAAAQRYHQIEAVKMARAEQAKPDKPEKPGPDDADKAEK
jgi:tetratricopeptide (TPR) repeat protein